MRHELRVDSRLPDAARDQLRVLAAEIQDEHRPLLRASLGDRKSDDLAHYPMPTFWACCRDLPSVLIDGANMTSAFWKSWIDS